MSWARFINLTLMPSMADFDFLQELEAPIIVPHSQQKTEQKYPFEMLFRSIQVFLSFSIILTLDYLAVRHGGQRLS